LFAKKYDFPFPLLSDPNRVVCLAYDACDGPDTNKAKRFTYVIGPDGEILEIFKDVRPHEHAEMVLNFLSKRSHPALQEIRLSMDEGVQISQHGASPASASNERRREVQNKKEQSLITESQLESTVCIVADMVPESPANGGVQMLGVHASEETIIPDLEANSFSTVDVTVGAEDLPNTTPDPNSGIGIQNIDDRKSSAEATIVKLPPETLGQMAVIRSGQIPPAELNDPSTIMAGPKQVPNTDTSPISGIDVQTLADKISAMEAILSKLQVDWPSPAVLENIRPSQLQPAQMNGNGSLVYSLGKIGYDFGTEARMDGITQAMTNGSSPHSTRDLLAHIAEHPYDAANIIWTLNLDDTCIYAIEPQGPYATLAYDRLCEFLSGQLIEGVQRVSIPGTIMGQVVLLSGQTVPVIAPALRGMYSWSTSKLVEAVLGQVPENQTERSAFEQKQTGITNFLERIYYELRNLGTRSQERAMNFAATNAFQITQVFEDAVKEGLELDKIEVEASPICRPGADCWDVKVVCFDPSRREQRARKVYRFTVDVSNVVPVTVGAVRSWYVY
jgi:hypothetical protein